MWYVHISFLHYVATRKENAAIRVILTDVYCVRILPLYLATRSGLTLLLFVPLWRGSVYAHAGKQWCPASASYPFSIRPSADVGTRWVSIRVWLGGDTPITACGNLATVTRVSATFSILRSGSLRCNTNLPGWYLLLNPQQEFLHTRCSSHCSQPWEDRDKNIYSMNELESHSLCGRRQFTQPAGGMGSPCYLGHIVFTFVFNWTDIDPL